MFAASCGNGSQPARTVDSAGQSVWRARGVVVSFGENRAFVRIHHEEIPGFMRAMTMAFEAGGVALGPLREGDAVDFTFEETTDGRRILRSLSKR